MSRRSLMEQIAKGLSELGSSTTLSPVERRKIADHTYRLSIEAGERHLQAEAALYLGSVRSSVVEPNHVLHALSLAEKIFASSGFADKASICKVLAARALCDLGRDVDAIDTARLALKELMLPAHYRSHAFAIMGLCQSRAGDHETAMSTLANHAMTQAVASGNVDAVVHVHWALGVAQLIRVAGREWPSLGRAMVPEARFVDRSGDAASVVSKFEEAKALSARGNAWFYIGLMRLLTFGLSGAESDARQSISALSTFGAMQFDSDPALAAWALSCKAELQLRHHHDRDAISSLSHGFTLAKTLGLINLQREALRMQGVAFERVGDIASALSAQRAYLSLQLVGVTPHPNFNVLWAREKPTAEGRRRLTFDADAVMRHRGVKRAMEHVAEHLDKNLGVVDIVNHSGVGRRTLELGFKASVGCTISEFVKQSRLRHVALQLLQTDGTISDVAAQAGYKNPGAFSRDFRRLFGVTPSVWKRSGSSEKLKSLRVSSHDNVLR